MATSLRLEPEIEKRLDTLSKRTGRTKAYYLRELIDRGIEDIEDYYLAEATMERLRKGEEQTYTAEEMRREVGLED